MVSEIQAEKLSSDQLRDLYRADYVSSFQKDRGRLRRLLPLMDLNRAAVVADLACGNGLLLGLIHDRVGFYHGVDFSSEFIEAARLRQANAAIENAAFHCQSIAEFCEHHPRQIDRAFAMDFTEHVYDDSLLEALRAIRRALKPDGRLYVHTPNAKFFLEILKDKGVLRQFPEHIAVRNEQQNRALLTKAGFGDVKVVYVPHYLWPLSWLHGLSWLPGIGPYFRARLFFECLCDNGAEAGD